MAASSRAEGISHFSGDAIAQRVAPLIAASSAGATSSAARARDSVSNRMPTVPTTVGSGAMPNTSA